MEIIWALMLTVCDTASCGTQTIQWFEERTECIDMQIIHENIPRDGEWKSVTYYCTIPGAKKI